jgi:PAS domain S-box-containing protein
MKSAKSMIERTDVEELLKILGDKSPVGVCIIQDGKFCYVNPGFPIVTGYTADELEGMDSLEIVVPEDRKMVRENAIKMLKGKLLSPCQFRVICKDGSIKWLMETVRSIRYHGRRATLGNYMEITERKQAEKALRQSEEKYRALFDSAVIGTIVLDAETTKVAMVNQAAVKMFGLSSAEEARGLNIFDFVFPDDREMAINLTMKDMFEQDLRQPNEIRVMTKDGRTIWISATGAKIMHEGRLAGLISFTDITERRKMEEALRQGEEKYRELFNSAVIGMVVLDAETMKVAMVNQAALNMFGFSSVEEAIVQNPLEFIVPEDRERALENATKDTFEQDLRRAYEFRAVTKDGREIWISTTGTRIMHEGRLAGLISFTDITERKQMEEKLRQSRERYRALFDSSVIGTLVVDAETMKVVMGNQAAVKMFGFSSAKEGAGVNPLDFVPSEDREKNLERIVKEVFEKDSRKSVDLKAVTSDGREIWVSATGARITHKGRLAGLISFTDITERKQAEEAVRQSEERYRTILEEMEDAYFEVDLGGHLTFVNNSVCRDLGYSREELIGMSYKGFTIEDDIESVFRVFNEVYRTGVPNKGFPWNIIRKDRNRGFAETSVTPLRNDKGEIVGFRGVGRDITERRKIVEALRQSEENYRALFDSSVTGAFVIDAETMKVVMGNQAASKVFGFSSVEEAIGVDPLDFIPPDDKESVLKLIMEEMFERDSRQAFDVRAITRDGREIWISATGARVMHEGRLGGLISFTDITERKRMEEELKQSEERYRTILEEMEDSYFEVDLGGHFTFVNSATCCNLGYSKEELIGTSYKKTTLEDDIESVFRVFNEVYRTGKSNKSCLWTIVCKDGTHRLVEHAALPLRNDKGEIIGFRGIGRDITERKQAEEALQQSEENYRVLFDNSVIGTIVLDAETMKVAMVNQAAAKMFGFSSAKEALGIDPLVFIRPEDKERILDIATKALFEQDSREVYELGAVTKDGREIWINATGARIMHEGKLAGLICFTDITEQKQQRERFIIADRLASLGELASGTAHELNNPLTSIVGFSQLLMEREVPDDIREDLKLINNEAQRAAKVTKNLLTFARKHAPMKQRTQINSIIDDVLRLRAHMHEENGIEVEQQLALNLPQIMVDYFQIQQVFINIVINAEYFMTEAHGRGTLTVTTKKQNDTVVISFTDDGPGIPPENLRRIFDPFFTTKEAGKGTGLGLSICHGIVAEHGGQIYARSWLGKGATIFVELPINDR